MKKLSLSPLSRKIESPILFGQRGVIALFTVLIASSLALAGTVIYQTLLQKKYQLKSTKEIELREVLHQLVDYTFGGIQKRWCFDEGLKPEPNCQPLIHSRSSERLLITQDSLEKIKQTKEAKIKGLVAGTMTIPEYPMSSVKIGSFPEWNLTPSELKDSQFMLKDAFEKYVDSTASLKITNIKLQVERIRDDPNDPSVISNEKYIKIELTANYTLQGVTKTLNFYKVMVFYPRKLNNMALILAGNLLLSEGSVAKSSVRGTKSCKPESLPVSKITKKDGTGLRFLSPVLIGGDVYVSDNPANPIANVKFYNKLFIAGGSLKTVSSSSSSSTPSSSFKPALLGAKFKDLENLKAFRGGIFLEEEDKGLSVFSGKKPCKETGEERKKCIKRGGLTKVDKPTTIKTTYPLVGATDFLLTYEGLARSLIQANYVRLGKERGFYDGKLMSFGVLTTGSQEKNRGYAKEVEGLEEGVEFLSKDNYHDPDVIENYALKRGYFYKLPTDGGTFKAESKPEYGGDIKKVAKFFGHYVFLRHSGKLEVLKQDGSFRELFSSDVTDISAMGDGFRDIGLCVIHLGYAKCTGIQRPADNFLGLVDANHKSSTKIYGRLIRDGLNQSFTFNQHSPTFPKELDWKTISIEQGVRQIYLSQSRGFFYGCAVDKKYRLFCWGDEPYYTLGLQSCRFL